jgi:hypothetical protein
MTPIYTLYVTTQNFSGCYDDCEQVLAARRVLPVSIRKQLTPLLVDHGQLLPNLVKEGLPTSRELIGSSTQAGFRVLMPKKSPKNAG